MLKKAVQQGRSERRGEAYASVRWASERRENAAGGLFQHPASQLDLMTNLLLRSPRVHTNYTGANRRFAIKPVAVDRFTSPKL